jgi:hypothetical protein
MWRRSQLCAQRGHFYFRTDVFVYLYKDELYSPLHDVRAPGLIVCAARKAKEVAEHDNCNGKTCNAGVGASGHLGSGPRDTERVRIECDRGVGADASRLLGTRCTVSYFWD